MKRTKMCLVLLSCLLCASTLTGCLALLAGGAAGAGSVVYVKGQLRETMDATVTAVHSASVATLKELGLPAIEDKYDELSAKMKSRFADGQDVWIDIEYITVQSSRLTIRVGIMGDERKSRQILDGIHRHLSEGGRKT